MPASDIGRLGILGGTFDPLHNGHLQIAGEALRSLELDLLLFVPAGSPWQKKDFSSAEDRFLMTVLATSTERHFAVSRMELDRRGPTYTVDTLQQLRSFYPSTQLFFLIGADALAYIPTWKGFEDLRASAEFVVVPRSGHEISVPEGDERWPRVSVLDMTPVDISATEIREKVRAQGTIDDLVPATVTRYIAENGLYVGSKEVGHV